METGLGERRRHRASWGDGVAGVRVALTGHTGFKGGWLAHLLAHLGAEVHGLALPPQEGRDAFFHVTDVAGAMSSSRFGDIRDAGLVHEWVRDTAPTVVLHLAAQSLVRASYAAPAETFATNVMGTVNVLEAVRATRSVRAAVLVTSDKCYDNQELGHAFTETDPLGGRDPYSASKAATEIAAQAYRHSFFTADDGGARIATARAGNVIGGGDWARDRLVPDIFRALCDARPVVLRSPNAIRPWQHVIEPLRGYIQLTEALLAGATASGAPADGPWNFGPLEGSHWTVRALAEAIVSRWGARAEGIRLEGAADDPPESGLLRLDTVKATRDLDFVPALTLDEALDLTAAWYRTHARAPSERATLTRDQIAAYLSRTR